MLIPISLIVAFLAGVAVSAPVTVWIHGLIVKAKAWETNKAAALKALETKVEKAI